MTGYPRPDWCLFNHISVVPLAGVVLVGEGIVQGPAWLVLLGIAAVVVGTWLTMRRLTGRVSERSLLWVLVDSTVMGAGVAVGLGLHLSGLAFGVAVGVPVLVSESLATALTGVKEAR